MITLKKILIPVDFSESSKKAVLYGVSFGLQYRVKVIMLSVVDDRIFEEASLFGVAEQEMRDNRKKVFQEKIDELVTEIKEKNHALEIEGVIRFGIPYVEIIKFAQEEEIDMIVMGSQGVMGIRHLLLGSTTDKVIRKAPGPVLTVRGLERESVEES